MLQNSLGEAVLLCTHNQCFEQNIKNTEICLMKFSILTSEKNLCISHGQVFVLGLWSNMAK